MVVDRYRLGPAEDEAAEHRQQRRDQHRADRVDMPQRQVQANCPGPWQCVAARNAAQPCATSCRVMASSGGGAST